MPRFFVDALAAGAETAILDGENGRHAARSLRMRPGESLVLSDGAGMDYDGEVAAISGDVVTVRILAARPNASEPKLSVTLYQGMPKADKLEAIVQKATELGAVRVVPMQTARCVSRPDEKAVKKRRERLSRIALEAAKQSGRGRVPEIGEMVDFKSAVQTARGAKILFYEGGGAPLSAELFSGGTEISVFIGPEGGFSEDEVQLARDCGVVPCTLGPRILRTETAPLAALAMLLFLSGDMA